MKRILLFLPVPILILAGIYFSLKTDLLEPVENHLLNHLQVIRKSPKVDERILLIETDPSANFTRTDLADGLILMAELNTGHTILDLSLDSSASPELNSRMFTKEYKDNIASSFLEVRDDLQKLINGEALLKESEENDEQYQEINTQLLQDQIKSQINRIERTIKIDLENLLVDHNRNLMTAISLHGSTFIPLEKQTSEKETALTGESTVFPIKPPTDFEDAGFLDRPTPSGSLEPSPYGLHSAAKAGGYRFATQDSFFNSTVLSKEQSLPAAELFSKAGDQFYSELTFAAIMDYYGSPEWSFSENALILHQAQSPQSGQSFDLRIPLNPQNKLIIRQPNIQNRDFDRISFDLLLFHESLFDSLFEDLQTPRDLAYYYFFTGKVPLLDQVSLLKQDKQDLLSGKLTLEEYRYKRDTFLTDAAGFLSPATEAIVQAKLLEAYELNHLSEKEYTLLSEDVTFWFGSNRRIQEELLALRYDLKDSFNGSFNIITSAPLTPTGSCSGSGVIANTILTRQFTKSVPELYQLIILIVLLIGLTIAQGLKRRGMSLLFGGGTLILVNLISAILLRYFSIHLPAVLLSAAIITTTVLNFVIQTIIWRIHCRFIHKTFSKKISGKALKQLKRTADTQIASGELKELTLLTISIGHFPILSEELPPQDLMLLLKAYNKACTKIILDNQGMIDYSSPENITALFGAPQPLENPSKNACIAASRIAQELDKINIHFMGKALVQEPLNFYMGIYSGDLIIGNSGSANRPRFSIIGPPVETVRKIEKANSLYQTKILIDENIKQQAGEAIIYKRLDKVCLKGDELPLQLYELAGEQNRVPQDKIENIGLFNAGLKLFLNRQWDDAEKLFLTVQENDSSDQSAAVYLKRIQEFRSTPPKASWNGIYSLEEIAANSKLNQNRDQDSTIQNNSHRENTFPEDLT